MLSSEAQGILANKRDKSLSCKGGLTSRNLEGARGPFTLGLLGILSNGRNIIQIIDATCLTGIILGHLVS